MSLAVVIALLLTSVGRYCWSHCKSPTGNREEQGGEANLSRPPN